MPRSESAATPPVGLWGAVAIGVGGMVGGGIFAVLGLAVQITKGAAPVAFLLAGLVALLTARSYSLLSKAYPSRGGAEDVADPGRTLTRAYYISVLFVIALYVLVAIVAVGSLPVAQLVNARDYALAEAARPALGAVGFTMIAVAAMLSTASAINATLYGSARMTYIIAKSRELPAQLERPIWKQPLEGLLITAGSTVLIANLLNLESISTMGSAGFLVIFAVVNGAEARTARRRGSPRPWISVLAAAACVGALGALVAKSSLGACTVLAGIVALAFGIEATFRRISGRPLRA